MFRNNNTNSTHFFTKAALAKHLLHQTKEMPIYIPNNQNSDMREIDKLFDNAKRIEQEAQYQASQAREAFFAGQKQQQNNHRQVNANVIQPPTRKQQRRYRAKF